MRTMILVIVVAAGVIAYTLIHNQMKPSPEDVTLYTIYFKAVDEHTGEALNVAIRDHNSSSRFPCVKDQPVGGPYQITCVSIDPPEFTISCKGYESVMLELTRRKGRSTIAGGRTLQIIRMKRK